MKNCSKTTFLFLYSSLLFKVIHHSIPAALADLACWSMGGKTKYLRLVNKMHKASEVLYPFTNKQWIWDEDNLKSLQDEMTQVDRDNFNFDVAELEWPSFLDEWIKGTRQYLLKEDLATLPRSRVEMDRAYWMGVFRQMIMMTLVAAFLYITLL